MLTIWGRKTSSNVQALMWCVGELGLTYERYDVVTATAAMIRLRFWP
jgi:glutathione S-transferase